jgi:hypothetical protein
MIDLLENVLEYMKSYQCTLPESIQDLDHPITHDEVKKVAEMAGWKLTNDEIQKLGRSDREVRSYEAAEQADYESVYGGD